MSTPPASPHATRRFAAGLRAGAIACLLVASAASVALVLAHFKAVALPGCGAGSGCGAAQASRWATVPGLGWPVSHLGAAYFVSMLLVLTLVVRGGVSRSLRWIVRLGAAVSVAFLVVLAVEPYWCNYCAAAHGANLLFLACIELLACTGPAARSRTDAGLGFAGLAVLSACMLVAESRFADVVQAAAVRDAAASTQRILHESDDARIELAGRYRIGAGDAKARLVVFFDYQCATCAEAEKQVLAVLERFERVSVEFKHFPYNRECNRAAGDAGHPNSCWAARASEAAGQLHGPDGFQRMHHWLFARSGGFVRSELLAFLDEQGWDVEPFEAAMQGEAVEAGIEADVEDGIRVGVAATPVVYVNGIELKGAHAPGQLEAAVEAVLSSAAESSVSAGDLALVADRKLIADWRMEPAMDVQLGDAARTRGPADAPVHVVAWVDYRTAKATAVDRAIRERMAQQPGAIRYSVAHFPLEEDCNPNQRTIYPGSCAMARFAEAAALVGGAEAFWPVHEWILENIGDHTNPKLLELLERVGLDRAAMHAAVSGEDVAAAIERDIAEAHRLGIAGVPMLLIDGRRVPLFSIDSAVRLDIFFDELLGPVDGAADQRAKRGE